jgi:hypothetical protein
MTDKMLKSQAARENTPWYKSDFVKGLAATPRGKKWYQAGAAASAYEDEMQKAYDEKDYAALKEILGEKSKLSEAKRGFKEKLFTIQSTEMDRVRTEAAQAMKDVGASEEKQRAAADAAQAAYIEREAKRQSDIYKGTNDWSINSAKLMSDMISRSSSDLQHKQSLAFQILAKYDKEVNDVQADLDKARNSDNYKKSLENSKLPIPANATAQQKQMVQDAKDYIAREEKRFADRLVETNKLKNAFQEHARSYIPGLPPTKVAGTTPDPIDFDSFGNRK